MNAKLMSAGAELVTAIVWPLVVIIIIIRYSDAVRGIQENIGELARAPLDEGTV